MILIWEKFVKVWKSFENLIDIFKSFKKNMEIFNENLKFWMQN